MEKSITLQIYKTKLWFSSRTEKKNIYVDLNISKGNTWVRVDMEFFFSYMFNLKRTLRIYGGDGEDDA